MKIKILYVEDEPFLGKIVKETLELKGFAVNWVTDGNEVMRQFTVDKPDVVVLDVMLPGKDGFAVGKDLRTKDQHIPIIFLTAKSQLDDLAQGFASGGTDYLRKPFSVEELVMRIQNQLNLIHGIRINQPLQEKGEEIAIKEYIFYPGRYELVYRGKVMKLSHRESQIMGMLATQQNKTIDRKDLLIEVWGDDSFFNSRNLDVYIRKLREYLCEDEGIQIITLKGKGYHFSVT
ncbi:MAG TPA: response regulator transcription factor [Luteibaculaceae bacterium]|nr:response regulator transcription factor [Luteibaculaceae bacterium]